MPTIARIGNIKIQIYAEDHNPPHFHVITPDREAIVALADLSILQGSLRNGDYRVVREWAFQHRRFLEDEWNSSNG
ncbi:MULTISPECIES: DUF4160 domain-containing protein [unclassified Phyllobacterium]|uniref:DUF4160 domain-containing protein n=1 Tax=Phyllobacterium TaxID=28100 RepID=UPI000886BD4D|nr:MULTISPECIES: DUF4160 domain-containing protein [unclassified Phyllobacterium]MBA8899627.1 hypothetical protein [Phyllobacterium sp. P30BS-XVII]UGX85628.1 DUF4160 domain-containing protein [Phyllobacterium sp. T1293]SDO53351.1 protein of unknown function [Phyllobacterium sp. OV277]